VKIEPDLWMLGSMAAFLLAAGGAVLRAGWSGGPSSRRQEEEQESELEALRVQLATAQGELAALQGQLAAAESSHEAQRAEMVEQRQRAERQVQGAQQEIQRLTMELETERTRAQRSDDATRELEGRLDGQDAAEMQRRLKAAGDERDAARAKVEALERLVEGVRARSRALAEELKGLKGE
jgi:predicted  nucleic acid-binding Zn-ribbon protein